MFLGHFQATPGVTGGSVPRYMAMRLRFCAVAVSRNSSCAPVSPRSRKRSTFAAITCERLIQRAFSHGVLLILADSGFFAGTNPPNRKARMVSILGIPGFRGNVLSTFRPKLRHSTHSNHCAFAPLLRCAPRFPTGLVRIGKEYRKH